MHEPGKVCSNVRRKGVLNWVAMSGWRLLYFKPTLTYRSAGERNFKSGRVSNSVRRAGLFKEVCKECKIPVPLACFCVVQAYIYPCPQKKNRCT